MIVGACGVVKVARKIRLEDEGNDVAYWLSRPPVERLRALDVMRRRYIEANIPPGKRRLVRVARIVKLKCGDATKSKPAFKVKSNNPG